MEIKAYCFVKTFGMRNERAGPFLPRCTEAPTLIVECERLQHRKRERETSIYRGKVNTRNGEREYAIEKVENNASAAEKLHYQHRLECSEHFQPQSL